MILESPKYFTPVISLYTVKHSRLLPRAIEVSVGNGLICIVYRYMFVGVLSVNNNGWIRRVKLLSSHIIVQTRVRENQILY